MEKVFLRAKKYLREGNSQILPVVAFDEIGLAELSKHNPLKVLHNLLELENREVGFIGISNWRLDASKMNRAMYLARPTPEKEELIFTAQSIYGYTIMQQHADHKFHLLLISRLAEAYFNYTQATQTLKSADFFGLRDYYHLIKYVSNALATVKTFNTLTLAKMLKKAIERNFDGQKDSSKKFDDCFLKVYPELSQEYKSIPDTPTFDLINENLADPRARFLMLICNGDIANYVLEKHLKLSKTESRLLVGSQMSEVENLEDIGFKDLKDIILFMEKGISVILKNMDNIYTSLYDLFNQNFGYVDKKRFCKIALGAQINPRCVVHEKFHVIVLMSSKDIKVDQVDAPFLNRFEKHCLDSDQLNSRECAGILNEILNWLERLMTLSNDRKILISLTNIFPLCSKEYLTLLINSMYSKEKRKDTVIEECKFELLKMASQEILSLSSFSKLTESEKIHIAKAWNDSHQGTFISYFTDFLQSGEPIMKSLVFTHDLTIIDSIYLKELEREELRVTYEDFDRLKSTKHLEHSLIRFFHDVAMRLYILDFNFARDSNELSKIKFTFENAAENYHGQPKHICLLARIRRNVSVDIDCCWFEGWKITSVVLSNQENFTIDDKRCSMTLFDLSQQQDICYAFDFSKLTFEAYQQIQLKTGVAITRDQLNDHMFMVIDNLARYENVTNAIRLKVESMMRYESKMWVDEVLCNPECYTDSVTLWHAVKKAIDLEVILVYAKVLFALEKCMAFHSVFFECPHSVSLQTLWISEFEKLNCQYELHTLKQSNEVCVTTFLDFPFSYPDHKLLTTLYGKYQQSTSSIDITPQDRISFISASVLSPYVGDLTSISEVRQLYIRDFVRIDLSTRKLQTNFEDFLVSILTCLYVDTSFDEEAWNYIQNRKFFLSLCEAFDLFTPFGCKASDQAREKIQILYARRLGSQSELPQEVTIDSIGDQSTASVDFPQENSSYGMCQTTENVIYSILATVLETSVSNLYPIELHITSRDHLVQISTAINKLYEFFLCFKREYQIEFTDLCLNELYMWKLLFEIFGQTLNGHDVLNSIGRKTKPLAIKDKEYIYDQQFVENISETVREHCPAAAQRFTSCYYTRLLKIKQPGTIQLIALHINNNDPSNDFWKQNAALCCVIFEQCYEVNDMKGVNFLKPVENSYLDELESVLSRETLSSRFAILLNDTLVRAIDPKLESMDDDQKCDYLIQNEQVFRDSEDAVYNPPYKYPLIMKLVASAHIRVCIEVYCHLLFTETPLREDCRLLTIRIKDFLFEPYFPAARLYALKYIKDCRKLTNNGLIQVLKEQFGEAWASFFQFPDEQEEIIFAELQGSLVYCKTSAILKSVLAGNVAPDIAEMLSEMRSAEARASFTLAFMVTVYFEYSRKQDNNHVLQYFTTIQPAVERVVGQALCQLIGMFVHNFPEGSFLRLTDNTTADELYIVVPLCYYLITALSHCDASCPITNVFFDRTGTILPNFAGIVNAAYLYGVGTNPLYDHLQYLKDHFDTEKHSKFSASYSKGSANKCSNTCDYVYIINKCGGPTETRKCPFCNSDIGGTSHKLVPREGHQNLTDAEALAFLEEKTTIYKGRQEEGYWNFSVGASSLGLRGISPLAHRILHFFLTVMMYFLKLSGTLSDQVFSQIIHSKEPITDIHRYFVDEIRFDFVEINRTLNLPETQYWWYSLVSQLPSFTMRHREEAASLANRTTFEQDFQNLIQQSCESPISVIQEAKKKAAQLLKSSVISLLEEVASPVEMKVYPNFEFFRMIRTPDIDNLQSQLQLLPAKFPLLNLYFKFQSSFPQLQLLFPVIELSNYLIQHFSHIKSRAEVRCMKVRELLGDAEFKQLFDHFTTVWERQHPSDLQYGCHRLPDKKRFTEEDELSYFMVDNQEMGGGMYMATTLIHLAEVQNAILNEFLSIMETITGTNRALLMDTNLYDVQQARSDMIIHLSLEESSALTYSFVNNPEYGKGREVIFDYQRLEDIIKQSLLKGRLLRTEPLSYVQYSFEALTTISQNSDLISAIRQLIPQEPFSEKEMKDVSSFFAKLEKSDKNQYRPHLRRCYSSLESLLCFLRTSTQNADTTIFTFAGKMNRFGHYDLYTKKSMMSDLSLKKVIALYEFFEMRFYPFMTDYIPEHYKKEDREVAKRIDSLDFSQLPKREDVALAVMRLIMRLLHGQLQADTDISLYLGRYDLWGENRDEAQIEELIQKLSNIQLAFVLQVYETLAKVKSQNPPQSAR